MESDWPRSRRFRQNSRVEKLGLFGFEPNSGNMKTKSKFFLVQPVAFVSDAIYELSDLLRAQGHHIDEENLIFCSEFLHRPLVGKIERNCR